MKVNKRHLIILGITLIFGLFLYKYNQINKVNLYNNDGKTYDKAVVIKVIRDNISEEGNVIGSQTVSLKLLSGKYKGEKVEAVSSSSYLYGAQCTQGMKVIAQVSEHDKSIYVTVYSYDRTYIIYAIIIIFMITLCLIGRKQGLNSCIALLFTFICIIYLFMPMIYKGVSPILAAIIVALLTTIVTMYLIGGFTRKTLTSIIGTILGVILSGLFALLFSLLSKISGYNVSEIEQLQYVGQMTNINIGELMYAGILIASLGAVMDVAMSVSSTINEIHIHNKELQFKELFRSGLNVGKDMMGTMSNTLILAFTGSSINTLIFMYAYNYPFAQIINMYSIGIEIIKGISATLGVILTVPIVSFLSAKWPKPL